MELLCRLFQRANFYANNLIALLLKIVKVGSQKWGVLIGKKYAQKKYYFHDFERARDYLHVRHGNIYSMVICKCGGKNESETL